MSGFRDAIKGFFNSLFGINRNLDEDFIFFWDEIDEDTEIVSEESEVSDIIRQNQTEILLGLSVLLILISLILADNDRSIGPILISTIPLYFAVLLIIVVFYNIQSKYKDPFNLINSSMERLKEMDFTDTGELLYMRNIPPSLQNLDTFRHSMAKMSENLDDTTIELMNSLFLMEEKLRSLEFAVDSATSIIDRSGLNTVNYQEIKYYSNQVSHGVDNFTSVFDDALNSNEDILGIIKSIGRQTNMLALNAGIEAARAGEMGLGFEVVSQNLRRLSQHATTTTSEMKALKTTINTNARQALETITNSMNHLTSNVDSSYSTFTEVNREIYNIKQTLSAVNEDINKIQHLINTLGTEIQHMKN